MESVALVVSGVFGFVGVLLGGVLLARHGREALFAYRIATTDPVTRVPPEDESRFALVRGSVQSSKTIRAPESETECVAYEYEIRERADGKFSHWEQLESGRDVVPFDIDSAAGIVHADAGVLRLIVSERQVQTENENDERQVIERRIDPGETIGVYGIVQPAPTDEWGRTRDDAVVTDDERNPLLVSDAGPYRTLWRVGIRPVLWSLLGFVLLAYGVSSLGYAVVLLLFT